MTLAMVGPLVLSVAAGLGGHSDPSSRRFLGMILETTGASPPFWGLAMAAGFYLVALFRKIPGASAGLSASLLGFAIVAPGTIGASSLVSPRALPLLILTAFQGVLAVRRNQPWRAVPATICLAWATYSGLNVPGWSAYRGIAAGHVALGSAMLLGAIVSGGLGRSLRVIAAVLLGHFAIGSVVDGFDLPPGRIPAEMVRFYPLAVAIVAAGYGRLIGGRPAYVASAVSLGAWGVVFGGQGYATLRRSVVGLDHIAWGLASFLLAATITLAKAGALPGPLGRWLKGRRSGGANGGVHGIGADELAGFGP